MLVGTSTRRMKVTLEHQNKHLGPWGPSHHRSFSLEEKTCQTISHIKALTVWWEERGQSRHLFCSCCTAQCRPFSSSFCLCPVHRSSPSPALSLDLCRALCLSLGRAPCLASRGASRAFPLLPLLEGKVKRQNAFSTGDDFPPWSTSRYLWLSWLTWL